MKKVIFIVLLCFLVEMTTTSFINNKQYDSGLYYNRPLTQRDAYIEQASRLYPLNEITLYIIDTSILEGVNPLDTLAYIKVENPRLELNAYSKNVVKQKVYNKKTKKYITVQKTLSEDAGFAQLNSKHISEFKERFWQDQNDDFDVYNYKHNIKVSIRLYKSLLKGLNNNSNSAVMAYNAGYGKITRKTIPYKTLMFYLPQFLNNKRIMEK